MTRRDPKTERTVLLTIFAVNRGDRLQWNFWLYACPGPGGTSAPFNPFQALTPGRSRVACSPGVAPEHACEEVKSSKTGLSQLYFSLRESDGVKSIQI